MAAPLDDSVTERLAGIAERAGLRRVHVVAWRDREDPGAGGSEEYVAQIARRWAAAGIDVTVRTGSAPGLPAQSERDGYRVVRRGGRMTVFPRTAVAELTGRAGRHDGLVDISHGIPFFSPVWERGPRVAVVHHVHLGTWHLLMPPGLAQVGHALERWAVPVAYRRSTMVATSEATRRDLRERLGLVDTDIRVATVGVDERFSPGPGRSPTPLVVALGRLMPQKGFDTVVRALARAHATRPDLQAVIVGDGPSRADLEKLAADLGAHGWLRFTGWVDDEEQVEHYRSGWVLANGSLREGWGMTITEAGACGTPSVATRIPGHDEALIDGESGILVDGVAEMADAIGRVIDDEALRERLAAGALAHAGRHSWGSTAETLLQALADDAARRRG